MATITERLLNSLNLITAGQAHRRALRAYEAGFNDSPNDEPPSGTLKSYGYKRQTTGSLRDFTQMSYDEILSTVWKLYQSNALVKRILSLKVAHYLGGGIEYDTEDEDTTEAIATSYDANKLDRELNHYALELRLWGEQIYPVFVRQTDGRVSLGYIDPGQIDTIITHPENAKERWAIVLKSEIYSSAKCYRVIRTDDGYVDDNGITALPTNPGLMVTADQTNLEPWEEKLLSTYNLTEYTGSALLFQVNNVSNQSRGFSDLLQIADWLDALDDTLFSISEREQFANYFSWDVTLEGADDVEVSTRLQAIMASPPKRGSVRVHNEKEQWMLNWPDLKQMGSIETVKAMLTFIVGSIGFPLHWFGFGGDANRATAVAQGDPTWKTLEQEQGIIKNMIVDILTLFRDQAIIAGTLPPAAIDNEITVTMPQMTTKDTQAIATAMSQMAQSLMIAEQNQWISKPKAIEVWQTLIQELGIDAENIEEIEAEETDETIGETVNEWLRTRTNGKPNY